MITQSSVTATVLKKHNSVWYGRGRVISVSLTCGTANLLMLTGRMAGKVGGFSIDTLKFHVE